MTGVQTCALPISTDQFAAKLNDITEKFHGDNETRTERVEKFLIEEAMAAGVVKAT